MVCCLLASTATAGTGREVALTAGLGSIAALVDLHSTEVAIRAGKQERLFGKTRGQRLALKGAGVTATTWLDWQLRRRGHNGTANAVRFIWVASQLGAAANNYLHARGTR